MLKQFDSMVVLLAKPVVLERDSSDILTNTAASTVSTEIRWDVDESAIVLNAKVLQIPHACLWKIAHARRQHIDLIQMCFSYLTLPVGLDLSRWHEFRSGCTLPASLLPTLIRQESVVIGCASLHHDPSYLILIARIREESAYAVVLTAPTAL